MILALFAYLDRIYRELGRVTTGKSARPSGDFRGGNRAARESSTRRDAALGFRSSRNWPWCSWRWRRREACFSLFPRAEQALAQLLVYLAVEILLFGQFIPYLLLAKTTGRWLEPLLPVMRAALVVTWPLRALMRAGHFGDAHLRRGGAAAPKIRSKKASKRWSRRPRKKGSWRRTKRK